MLVYQRIPSKLLLREICLSFFGQASGGGSVQDTRPAFVCLFVCLDGHELWPNMESMLLPHSIHIVNIPSSQSV